MKPSQVVNKLRQIATAVENSKKPDKNLVVGDVQLLINKIAIKAYPKPPEGTPEAGEWAELEKLIPKFRKLMSIMHTKWSEGRQKVLERGDPVISEGLVQAVDIIMKQISELDQTIEELDKFGIEVSGKGIFEI
jgi:hypothetical protein